MSNPNIYLFLPYYGRFPNYFQLYLDSLIANKDTLKIILITDINVCDFHIPDNVYIVNISFEQVRIRARDVLAQENICNFNTNLILQHHYKLCDFKPLYYLIFKDIVKELCIRENIDYIGYGDCDVIYGNLAHFIDFKKKYILIGEKGHFTAVLNNNDYLSVWKKCGKFKSSKSLCEFFTSNNSCFFDENIFVYYFFELPYRNLPQFVFYNTYADILPPNHKDVIEEERNGNMVCAGTRKIVKYLTFDRHTGDLLVFFKDGSMLPCSYIHLQKRNMIKNFDSYLVNYRITNSGFYIID